MQQVFKFKHFNINKFIYNQGDFQNNWAHLHGSAYHKQKMANGSGELNADVKRISFWLPCTLRY